MARGRKILRAAGRLAVYSGTLATLCVALAWSVLGWVEPPALPTPREGSQALYDARGDLLGLSLAKDERYRLYVPLAGIAPEFIRATLLYEDAAFFTHPGVNGWSLLRAALATAARPERPVGGSTISMQLARLQLGLETRSLSGKLRQCFWAFVLERHYSKQQILEAYLNIAPYGSNVEGIGAASLIYFKKRAEKLSAAESVSLAVVPQNPALRWRAAGRASLEGARTRLALRLGGVIPREFVGHPGAVPRLAPHFFDRVRQRFPTQVEFESTLRIELQNQLREALSSSLEALAPAGVKNVAAILVDSADMSVRGYIGSADYLDESIDGYVNGLAAPRSPGSLLKPFVFGLAIDQGIITPATMLHDVPLRISSYRPENFERNFSGPISARDALVRSRNVPALELFAGLSPGSLFRLLQKGGVRRLQSPEHYGMAIVLGGLGTTAEELAQLYGALANGGSTRALKMLTAEGPHQERRLLSPESAFLVSEMLSANPSPAGDFRAGKVPWKTGTSYGSKDAWAAGLIGRYIAVVWVGNFDNTPNPNLVGREIAGPLLFSLAERLKVVAALHPIVPSPRRNLKSVKVCALSGALPSAACPHTRETLFIPGVSPIQPCMLHQRIPVDPITGLRVCNPGEPSVTKVFEVWDSRMLRLFARAGLQRNVPPEFPPTCELRDSNPGSIRIISPEEHLEYLLQPDRELEIEFLAAVAGDSQTVRWFVDDVAVGELRPDEALLWRARAGDFVVRAVDSRGRSTTRNLRVNLSGG